MAKAARRPPRPSPDHRWIHLPGADGPAWVEVVATGRQVTDWDPDAYSRDPDPQPRNRRGQFKAKGPIAKLKG